MGSSAVSGTLRAVQASGIAVCIFAIVALPLLLSGYAAWRWLAPHEAHLDKAQQ